MTQSAWRCPECLLVMSDLERKLAKFDKCPCCEKESLKDFKMEIWTDEPTGNTEAA